MSDEAAKPVDAPAPAPTPRKAFGAPAKPATAATPSPAAVAAPKAEPPAENGDPQRYTFRLYRCHNCDDGVGEPGFDFSLASNQPAICPRCKIRQGDGRSGALITTLTVIHFDPPDTDVRTLNAGTIACNPKVRVGGGVRASCEPAAVNCPACRRFLHETKADQPPFDPQHDFVIEAGYLKE